MERAGLLLARATQRAAQAGGRAPRRRVSARAPKESRRCPASGARLRRRSPHSPTRHARRDPGRQRQARAGAAFPPSPDFRARSVETRLWQLAEEQLPPRAIGRYTQALMDLGATLCTRAKPACARCPLAQVARRSRWAASGIFPRRARRRPCLRAPPTCCCSSEAARCCWKSARPRASGADCGACPRLADGARVRAHCRTNYGCSIAAPQPLAPLAHGLPTSS